MEKSTKKQYDTPETVVAVAETGSFICTSIQYLQMTPQVDKYVSEEAVNVPFE